MHDNAQISNLKKIGSAIAFYGYNHFFSHFPSYFIRKAYLQNILRIKIGIGTAIHMGCFITGNKIIIGERTVINRKVFLDGRFGLDIGSDVSISPNCCLLSLGHDPNSETFESLPGKIQLGSRCWLGFGAMILPGITLGEGCVVGAGSIVTKSFTSFQIIAGNPAKLIGNRNSNLIYELNYFPWFDTDVLP